MHDYYHDCTNNMKASWNKRSLIPIMSCIALTMMGLWFPSWYMYIAIACAFSLAIFLLITILFVLVWALTRFMVN